MAKEVDHDIDVRYRKWLWLRIARCLAVGFLFASLAAPGLITVVITLIAVAVLGKGGRDARADDWAFLHVFRSRTVARVVRALATVAMLALYALSFVASVVWLITWIPVVCGALVTLALLAAEWLADRVATRPEVHIADLRLDA